MNFLPFVFQPKILKTGFKKNNSKHKKLQENTFTFYNVG